MLPLFEATSLMRGQETEGSLLLKKKIMLSVVGMAVFLFVFTPEWRPVYFQKMMLDPAFFKISPTSFFFFFFSCTD